MYTGGNEVESEKRQTDIENGNEDLIMMNIPREGNAD
jgi:hypothetical protein